MNELNIIKSEVFISLQNILFPFKTFFFFNAHENSVALCSNHVTNKKVK